RPDGAAQAQHAAPAPDRRPGLAIRGTAVPAADRGRRVAPGVRGGTRPGGPLRRGTARRLLHPGGAARPGCLRGAAGRGDRDRAAAAGLSTVEGLLGWWARRLAGQLAGHGRRAAFWDELLDHGAPAGSLIFAWRDAGKVTAAQAAGHDVVAVPQPYLYLDWAE